MATPTNFKDVGKRLKKSVDSLGGLAEAIAYANANGTAESPVEIPLAVPLNIPNTGNFTLDKTGVIEQFHGAALNFQGLNGKLTLIGRGVKDLRPEKPIFLNAPVNNYSDANQAAGQANHKGVKWSDGGGTAKMPAEISTEVFGFTAGNSLSVGVDSLSHRIKRVELAFPLTHKLKVVCSPRTTDAQVLLRYNRKYYFTYGEYPNTWAGANDPDITQWRVEPFILHCPKDTRFDLEMEAGVKFWLSNTVNRKAFIYPDDAGNIGEMGSMFYKNIQLWAQRNIENSGGLNLIRTGNCQKCEIDGMYLIGIQDYPVTMGGDPRNFFHGKNITVRNVYILDSYNYQTHGLNYENGLLEDYLMEVLTLPANKTVSAADEEPNGTEEFLKNNTYRRVFFKTNQGTALAGDPVRQFTYYQTACFVAQAGSTDGYYGLTYDDCGYECPSRAKDSLGQDIPEFASVQQGVYAYGHYDLKIIDFKATGGGGNGLFRLDLCRKMLIENPQANSSYSGKIHLVGTGETTIIINEGQATPFTGKVIQEEEWGHPVLVNGNVLRMFDDWTTQEGRVYKWYSEFGGWKLDFMNQRAVVNGYATTRNFTNYPYKRITTDISFGSKTVLSMSSISGNTITNAGHGLTTGESLDYSSSGVMFNELKDFPYSSASYPDVTSEPRRVYAIVLNANQYKLANSLRNSFAGTAISGFTGGSGTHSLQRFYLTAKSVLPAGVDIANNRVHIPNHNLVKGTAVQYRNYTTTGTDANTPIGGLERASTNDSQTTINGEKWFGFYWVFPDPADPTNYLKFAKNKPDALAEVAIDLTDDGDGFHQIIPMAMTDNSDTNIYILPKGWTVDKRNPLSKSRIIYHQNWKEDAIGLLPSITGSLNHNSNDSVPIALAKLYEQLKVANPPIWEADRFYHFKASDLVGVVANGARVTTLPNSVAGGTFEFSQATNILRAFFFEADENGMPYIYMEDGGYLANENFPSLTAGFAFAVKGAALSILNDGYFRSTLNNNTNSASNPEAASWNFSLLRLGNLRWYNSGAITTRTRDNTPQLVLGTTGATSKIYRNGANITDDDSLITKPTRLNIGHPYGTTTSNIGEGSRIYEIVFWDKDLDADIINAFNEDHAV